MLAILEWTGSATTMVMQFPNGLLGFTNSRFTISPELASIGLFHSRRDAYVRLGGTHLRPRFAI